MSEYTRRLDCLYSFEDDSRVLDYRFPSSDLPMWMFARLLIKSLTVNTEEIINKDRIRNHFKPFTHDNEIELNERNPFNSQQRDLLYFGYKNLEMRENENGLMVETRYSPYIMAYPDKTATIVSFSKKTQWGLKCDYPNWYSDFALIQEGERITDKVNGEEIRRFIEYLRANYPFEIDNYRARIIMKALYNAAARLESRINACVKILERVQPKIVFIELACFLHGYKIPMILACRRNGIPTADIQFAQFDKYLTTSYFYGTAINNDVTCKTIFPDYILTKGSFWNKKIAVPSSRFVIGAPFQKRKGIVNNDHSVLFCLGVQFEKTHRFLQELYSIVDDGEISILLRPHPGTEEKAKEIFAEFEEHSGFSWASGDSLNHYFGICNNAIIEHPSSTEYEAAAMGLKVFVLDVKSGFSPSFENMDDIDVVLDAKSFMDKWRKRGIHPAKIHSEFFDLDWEKNMASFLIQNKVCLV